MRRAILLASATLFTATALPANAQSTYVTIQGVQAAPACTGCLPAGTTTNISFNYDQNAVISYGHFNSPGDLYSVRVDTPSTMLLQGQQFSYDHIVYDYAPQLAGAPAGQRTSFHITGYYSTPQVWNEWVVNLDPAQGEVLSSTRLPTVDELSQMTVSSIYAGVDSLGGTISFSPSTQGRSTFQQAVEGAVKVYAADGVTSGTWSSFSSQYDLSAKYNDSDRERWSQVFGDTPFLQNGIGAAFTPNGGLSLSETAALGGYDHFNWSQVYYDPVTGALTLDPPLNHSDSLETSNYINRDNLNWYLDERFTVEGERVFNDDGTAASGSQGLQTRLQAWTDNPDTLLFSDDPSVTNNFYTCLVGVKANGTADFLSPSDCFNWRSSGDGSGLPYTEGLGNSIITSNGFLDPNNTRDQSLYGAIQAITLGVPEPATWAMLLLGFGAIGASMRRRTGTNQPLQEGLKVLS